MKMRHLLLITCIVIGTSIFAQNKLPVTKVYSSKPIDLANPIFMDSTNLKGVKFKNENLLETFVSAQKESLLSEKLESDIGGYFYLKKAQSGARFYLLSFQFTADRYSKVKIKLTAPSMLELYVNDKKELSKTSIEDTLTNAKMVEKEITCIPQTNTIVIKYLSLSSNISPEAIKIAIEPVKGDSITTFDIIDNGKQQIRINDILEGKRITSTNLSPDGQFTLLNYRTTFDDGKTSTSIELYNNKNKTRSTLSYGEKVLGWTPLTSQLYYVEKNNDGLQLITVNPQTLVSTVMAEKLPNSSFNFSPNEKFLLIREREAGDEKKGDLILLASPEDRQAGYLDRYFIYKYDLATGIKQRLTYGKNTTKLNDISADSRYLLFSITKETVTRRPFRETEMYKLDLETMQIDTIWTNESYAYSARFSPDGTSLLIQGAPSAFGDIGLNLKEAEIPNGYDGQLFLMNLQNKSIEAVSKNFDPSINDAYWNITDKLIYLRTVDRDYERVYTYNPKTKIFKLLPLNEDVVRQISLADRATTASYMGVSASNSTKAYILDLTNLKSTLIADPYAERLTNLKIGEVKDWNFKSADGTTIEGRYYLPPNFDPSKKYPLIVYYYGGTMPTSRSLDSPYPLHVYAGLGYVVYTLQPSGTIGFGQDFSAKHVNTWGKGSADDIIDGTKQFVSEHPFVDGSKIGCIGASYGGFMTMYLQTRTDLFAAAVSHAGISSISSYWGEGYWGYTYSAEASANSYPWNNKDLYVNQSPLFSADKINTPILLLHGTEDTNVPIGESIQMYTALKILGKPVEFIQVKGENHGIATYKKRIDWNYSIYAWFAKWLKNDPSWWDSLYPTTIK